jgi:hypothetical protein
VIAVTRIQDPNYGRMATTDVHGVYTMTKMSAGSLSVAAAASGYQERVGFFAEITSRDEPVTLNIVLFPIGTESQGSLIDRSSHVLSTSSR